MGKIRFIKFPNLKDDYGRGKTFKHLCGKYKFS